MDRRVAIITGGTRGIGLACARRLAAEGFAIVAAARSVPASVEGLPEDTLLVQADIARTQDRQSLIDAAITAFGRIDLLVNNAGVAPARRTDLLEMTEDSYDRVMDINVRGTLFLTQITANVMLKQQPLFKKRGTIINIGSCSAEVSSVSRGEYCVSKAAVGMITKLFADRLAGCGIYVHEIRPGIIETDMTAGVREKYDSLIEKGVFPIARWGNPEDVANAVSAFAGDNFLYTTGNVVDLDGGFHIKRL
ncbi:MAG: 3-ketoacyl-ACP reductase [Clostridia bacterium]|nr:3-ketoacyl-ACP reductase [Clostridia bacterium]